MSAPPPLLELLNAYRFDEAIHRVDQNLRQAAAESPERLTETARGIVAWQGVFGRASQAAASEPYFRAVCRLVAELAGPDSPPAMAAAENLAGILGSLGKVDEAITLREKVMASISERFPPDDPRRMRIRDGLAFLYQRAGREEKLADLYRDLGLCEHLAAAAQYILGKGAKVVSCGQPWSENCHIWAYFDALLDCEKLIRGLHLDSCIKIHDHRGSHEGSERGLVCTIHKDAVMGPHPADSGPGIKTITVA
jgi:hypothetical protein